MKTRLDFVSNSSTSSYIVSSDYPSLAFINGISSYGEYIGNDSPYSDPVYDYIQNYTAMTLMDINFVKPKRWIGTCLGKLCVQNNFINTVFDSHNNIRSNLWNSDIVRLIWDFTWVSWFNPNYHEKWVKNQVIGKVNDLTVKFSRWIFDAIAQRYEIKEPTKERYLSFIDEIEKELKERNVYVLWCTSGGDGYESGKCYFTFNKKVPDVKTIFEISKVVHKVLEPAEKEEK